MTLEVYRRTVEPGMYRFGSEVLDGKLTGRIIEERQVFFDHAEQQKYPLGMAFGFWPLGFGADQPVGSPVPGQRPKAPPMQCVAKQYLAPDSFLAILAQHVNQKTGLNSPREAKGAVGNDAPLWERFRELFRRRSRSSQSAKNRTP